MVRDRSAALLLALLAVAAACGRPSPPQANRAQATSTPAPSPAAAAPPSTSPQPAQPMVDAVDFERLLALLPEVDGWSHGMPKGERVDRGVTMSHASMEYIRGDVTIDLDISDSSFNQLVLAPITIFLAPGYDERDDEDFTRAAPVGGHPGFEKWDEDAREGEVAVVVANRFIVDAKAHGAESLAPAKAFVRAVNLKALAALR